MHSLITIGEKGLSSPLGLKSRFCSPSPPRLLSPNSVADEVPQDIADTASPTSRTSWEEVLLQWPHHQLLCSRGTSDPTRRATQRRCRAQRFRARRPPPKNRWVTATSACQCSACPTTSALKDVLRPSGQLRTGQAVIHDGSCFLESMESGLNIDCSSVLQWSVAVRWLSRASRCQKLFLDGRRVTTREELTHTKVSPTSDWRSSTSR